MFRLWYDISSVSISLLGWRNLYAFYLFDLLPSRWNNWRTLPDTPHNLTLCLKHGKKLWYKSKSLWYRSNPPWRKKDPPSWEGRESVQNSTNIECHSTLKLFKSITQVLLILRNVFWQQFLRWRDWFMRGQSGLLLMSSFYLLVKLGPLGLFGLTIIVQVGWSSQFVVFSTASSVAVFFIFWSDETWLPDHQSG